MYNIDFATEVVVEVDSDKAAEQTAQLCSIRPELQQYEWDGYSSDYYYSKLSAKEQLLYERLDAVCGELLSSAKQAAETYKVKSDGKTLTRRGTKMVSTLGLTAEQVKKVQTLFVYANPQYYFLNTILFRTGDDQCALGMYDAFAAGSARAAATQEVYERLEELTDAVDADGTVYEKDAQIHDIICEEMDYLKGDVLTDKTDPYYTQTIYGALVNGETVCAGYTKLYEMLCNYFGIDCVAVTSDKHAWNVVRYGENWYVVDVTWNDTKDRSKFYHITEREMLAFDQEQSHVAYSFYEGLLPEADTPFADSLKVMEGLEQPEVTLTDTAKGVTITFEAAEGDVYYTLDGTVPDASDRYRAPIELVDSGVYMVTAVTAADGKVASAYEIFPVRIAGGSVSVASAKNVSGKKIQVKLTAKKNYAGYEISYASKKDFSNQKSAVLKGKSATISGLKKGKTYYVRVRGYRTDAYGNAYYTAYSKAKKIVVKK